MSSVRNVRLCIQMYHYTNSHAVVQPPVVDCCLSGLMSVFLEDDLTTDLKSKFSF